MSRLADVFARLKKDGRAAFIPFLTGGDPDMETSLAILEKLPGVGADVIEHSEPHVVEREIVVLDMAAGGDGAAGQPGREYPASPSHLVVRGLRLLLSRHLRPPVRR